MKAEVLRYGDRAKAELFSQSQRFCVQSVSHFRCLPSLFSVNSVYVLS